MLQMASGQVKGQPPVAPGKKPASLRHIHFPPPRINPAQKAVPMPGFRTGLTVSVKSNLLALSGNQGQWLKFQLIGVIFLSVAPALPPGGMRDGKMALAQRIFRGEVISDADL